MGEGKISEAWERPKRSDDDFEVRECKRYKNKRTFIIGVGRLKSVVICLKCLIGKYIVL